jgi:Superfamily II RNA helicase
MSSPAQRYAAFRKQQAQDGPELTRFQALYDFSFDEFQRRACQALDEGHGVLVAAPTGSGKTVVGEFAVHLALAEGRKCFYTTPIKALSNQKYGDLVRRYGAGRVGLLTGDNSINGEAPVVVMTTEVLRNMLYGGSATLSGLSYVVLDEVHYLADAFRGAVWEEVIIHLPESVRVVAPVGHGQQRRGVRRLADPGPGRDHRDRGRAPPGAAVAARAGGRAAL